MRQRANDTGEGEPAQLPQSIKVQINLSASLTRLQWLQAHGMAAWGRAGKGVVGRHRLIQANLHFGSVGRVCAVSRRGLL